MAFQALVAHGQCPKCYLPFGSDAVIHMDGGANHALHRKCLQIWLDEQKRKEQTLSCPYCFVEVTSIETEGEALIRASEQGNLEAVQVLMKNGLFFMSYDLAVVGASRKGHSQIVTTLLSNGDISNEARGWALEVASENGYLEVVKILLTGKMRYHTVSTDHLKESLCLAKKNGHENIVAMLEQKEKIRNIFEGGGMIHTPSTGCHNWL